MATQKTTRLNADFFADLVRCEIRLYNHFDSELRAAHDIVTSQYEFLRHLRDHDGQRTTDLAAVFAIGVGAVSKSIDRLEARGLVARTPNPANRRSTILVLTHAGRALIDAAEATFQTRLDDILGRAGTKKQVAAAAAFMSALHSTLAAGRLGLPVG